MCEPPAAPAGAPEAGSCVKPRGLRPPRAAGRLAVHVERSVGRSVERSLERSVGAVTWGVIGHGFGGHVDTLRRTGHREHDAVSSSDQSTVQTNERAREGSRRNLGVEPIRRAIWRTRASAPRDRRSAGWACPDRQSPHPPSADLPSNRVRFIPITTPQVRRPNGASTVPNIRTRSQPNCHCQGRPQDTRRL